MSRVHNSHSHLPPPGYAVAPGHAPLPGGHVLGVVGHRPEHAVDHGVPPDVGHRNLFGQQLLRRVEHPHLLQQVGHRLLLPPDQLGLGHRRRYLLGEAGPVGGVANNVEFR